MKYISVTIRDTLLTVGIWVLAPVEEEMVRNACLTTFYIFLNLKAGGVVLTYLPNTGRLLEY